MTAIEAAEIEVEKLKTPSTIPTKLISLTGKQSTLVNREDNLSTEVSNGKITAKFKNPTWIYDITLWLSEENAPQLERLAKQTKIVVKLSRGNEETISLNQHQEMADYYIKDFVDEIQITFFGIGKLKTLLSPIVCRKIDFRGLSSEDFFQFTSSINNYISSSTKFHKERNAVIEELKATDIAITEKSIEITGLEESIANLTTEIETLTSKERDLQVTIERSQAKLEITNNKTTELEDKSTSQTEINNSLIKDIENNRLKRDKLLTDNNIFMEEFSSYVKQGRESIRSYFIIGIACFAILSTCLYRLITSSQSLAGDPEILKEISAFDLLLSRLPFALVLGLIMVAAMKIMFQLLSRTFEIHQERLLLTKLSIIAKDNAFFSADGLDIPSELIYTQKSMLKMELLKEFLSGDYRNVPQKQIELKNRFQDFITKQHQLKADNQAHDQYEDIETPPAPKK